MRLPLSDDGMSRLARAVARILLLSCWIPPLFGVITFISAGLEGEWLAASILLFASLFTALGILALAALSWHAARIADSLGNAPDH